MSDLKCLDGMWTTFYPLIYKTVDDPSSDPIISWSKSNNSFIVWNVEAFDREIRPESYEFGRDFLQFMSQLEFYGLQRIEGSEQWEFGHEYFVRGQPELMKKMVLKCALERTVKFGAKLKAKRAKAKAKRAKAKAKAKLQVEHLLQLEDRLQHLRI